MKREEVLYHLEQRILYLQSLGIETLSLPPISFPKEESPESITTMHIENTSTTQTVVSEEALLSTTLENPQEPLSPVPRESTIPRIQEKNTTPSFFEKESAEERSLPPSETQSLQELYQKYCNCTACPLHQGRTNFVFGQGNPKAKIVFIGEGPGEQEDRQGLPFVGRSGQLLTKMLNTIGLSREEIYIANIVKCRPPMNRNPEPVEIASCTPILNQQLQLIDPQLIVTLGNVSTRYLIPSAPGITKANGNLFDYHHWKVIPTFHPAFLLRNAKMMTRAWENLQMIVNYIYGISVIGESPK